MVVSLLRGSSIPPYGSLICTETLFQVYAACRNKVVKFTMDAVLALRTKCVQHTVIPHTLLP